MKTLRVVLGGIVGAGVGSTIFGIPVLVFVQAGGLVDPLGLAMLAFAIVSCGWLGAFFAAVGP